MDVFGLGVLIMGESGIGKSECALDLIDRGHRLVADDVVEIKRTADALIGSSPDLTRYHMELRGLGVLNIKDLYGVSSIRLSKRVELVIKLERWEAGSEYDRLGLRDEKFLILGVEVPLVRMPVAPGRNIALLVEVAARNQLLKERGYDAARRFAERVDAIMARAPPGRGAAAAPARAEPAARAGRVGPACVRGGPAPSRRPRAPRDHRALRLGQDPRGPRAGGRRLVLRRQPPLRAHPPLRRAHPQLARAQALRPGRGRPRAELPAAVPGGVPPAEAPGTGGLASSSWRPTSGSWCGASARRGGPTRWP